MDCPTEHARLIKQVGPMDSEINRYRCITCGEMLIVLFRKAEIEVVTGNEQNENKITKKDS